MSAPRFSDWHPVRAGARGPYAPIPKGDVSGIYVIANRRTLRPYYVGMSFTGRLRRTFQRHFQAWQQDFFHPNPRQTYDAQLTAACWMVIAAGGERAVRIAERAAMVEFRPRDNYLVPAETVEEFADVAPF